MTDEPRRRIATDSFEDEHMSAEGDVVLRDKLASRTMATALGIPALLTLPLAIFLLISTGSLAAALGPLFASVVLTLCAVTMTVVRTVVTSKEVMVRFGLWGPRVRLNDVVSARVVPYPLLKYGGWGIRRGIDGSWAYTMLGGTERVVELAYRDGVQVRKVVFSAERPDAVASAILRAKGVWGVPDRARIESDDEVEREAQVEVEAEVEPEVEVEVEALDEASRRGSA